MTPTISTSVRASSTVVIRPTRARTLPTITVRTSGTSGAPTAPPRTRCRLRTHSSISGRTPRAMTRTCSLRTMSWAWACTLPSTDSSPASTARRSSMRSPAARLTSPASTPRATPPPPTVSTVALSMLTTRTTSPVWLVAAMRSVPTPGRTRWARFPVSPSLSTCRAFLPRLDLLLPRLRRPLPLRPPLMPISSRR